MINILVYSQNTSVASAVIAAANLAAFFIEVITGVCLDFH